MKEATEVVKFNGSRMEVKNRKNNRVKRNLPPGILCLKIWVLQNCLDKPVCLDGGSKSI